ncbi:MAG: VCBS repeat-containing protein, partial [Polyangiales bacterium]
DLLFGALDGPRARFSAAAPLATPSRNWLAAPEVRALAPPSLTVREVLAPGDLDGDGLADAVLLDATTLRAVHGRRAGAAFVTDPSRAIVAETPTVPRAWEAGDVNRDGFRDLFVTVDARTFEVDYGGPGVFPARTQRVSVTAAGCADTTTPVALAGVGDVTGDGFADALVASCGTAEALLFRGGASGLESTPQSVVSELTPEPGARALVLAFGDLTGDGVAEYGAVRVLRAGTTANYRLAMYLGGPSSWTTIVRTRDLGGRSTWRAAPLGDLDADGFGDAVLRDAQGVQSIVLVRGAATPSAMDLQLRGPNDARIVAGGDIDGDGVADAIVQGVGGYEVSAGVRGGSPSSLLQPGGAPTRVDVQIGSTGPRLAVGPDLDGDGVDDLIFATDTLGTYVHSLPRPRTGYAPWPAVPLR